jgi:hypothetical protein
MIEMTDITLNDITSGYNVSRINVNFGVLEGVINNEVLHRLGGNNTMLQDLDMNNYAFLNVRTDLTDPDSLITLVDADLRYYNVAGDTLTGTMNVSAQTVTGLKQPVGPTEAVRKLELDQEISARVAADVNQQAQMTGNVPLEASAFSVISWHDQSVDNSVSIPASKNAWSFGPTMTISLGQVVTVGAGSFWTIANGAVV